LPRGVQVLTVQQALSFLIVGAFWGCTNPLLKRASHGINEVKGGWLAVRAACMHARARQRRAWAPRRGLRAGAAREEQGGREPILTNVRNFPGAGAEVRCKPPSCSLISKL